MERFPLASACCQLHLWLQPKTPSSPGKRWVRVTWKGLRDPWLSMEAVLSPIWARSWKTPCMAYQERGIGDNNVVLSFVMQIQIISPSAHQLETAAQLPKAEPLEATPLWDSIKYYTLLCSPAYVCILFVCPTHWMLQKYVHFLAILEAMNDLRAQQMLLPCFWKSRDLKTSGVCNTCLESRGQLSC